MDNRPIGIFDSGLGGLTTVRELKSILPAEGIVYFGDTGRVPYGTRSRETVRRYAGQDIRFLLSKDVKMIIAACNTASASLLPEDISALPVPFIDALLPAVKAAAQTTKNGRIAVIGTQATIRSNAYQAALRQLDPAFEVTGAACPLFVPLVENGCTLTERGSQVIRLMVEEYLSPVRESGADTLILGCTHYPILRRFIGEYLTERVELIDSGREAARAAKERLCELGMCNLTKMTPNRAYFVSDSVEDFSGMACSILGEKMEGRAEKIDIESD